MMMIESAELLRKLELERERADGATRKLADARSELADLRGNLEALWERLRAAEGAASRAEVRAQDSAERADLARELSTLIDAERRRADRLAARVARRVELLAARARKVTLLELEVQRLEALRMRHAQTQEDLIPAHTVPPDRATVVGALAAIRKARAATGRAQQKIEESEQKALRHAQRRKASGLR